MAIRSTILLILSLAIASTRATSAADYCPRAQQVNFNGSALQSFMNSNNCCIDVATDQADTQTLTWLRGRYTDALVIILAGASVAGTIGVYDPRDTSMTPALRPVFPPTAQPGWYAIVGFNPGGLSVGYFDSTGYFRGQFQYTPGLDPYDFGIYLQSSAGTVFTQDARNAGLPQALGYLGMFYDATSSQKDMFLCFEAGSYTPTSAFTSVILHVAPLTPCVATPTRASSWGHVKTLYR